MSIQSFSPNPQYINSNIPVVVDDFCIVKKSLAELTNQEIFCLRQTCSPTGVFKEILANLENNKIANAKDVHLSIIWCDQILVGWLYADYASEYDKSLNEGECSIMIYIRPEFRKLNLAEELISHNKEYLSRNMLVAYPRKEVKGFFRKMGRKHKLRFKFKSPRFYCKVEWI